MKFITIAVWVATASLVVHLHVAFNPSSFPTLIILNVSCLALLASAAMKRHKGRVAGFDVIVATELIVSFGIMSLILSLAVGLYPFFTAAGGLKLDEASLRQAAIPFLEGLATAGIAPLTAMLVRVSAAETDALIDPVGDSTDLAKAMGALTKELSGAHEALAQLQSASRAAVDATRALADGVASETERLKFSITEGQSEIRALGGAARDTREHVAELATATDRLRGSSSEAGTMLDTLSRLIESVQRFVAPGAGART